MPSRRTVALPEARTLELLRTRLRACELEVPADCTIEARDSVLDGVDLAGRRLGGRVDGLDATAAQLSDVTLSGVGLEGVVLDRARCERVDLTAADLTSVTAVATLAGATISPAQAVTLAARMARSLGIRVHDPGGDGSGFPPSP